MGFWIEATREIFTSVIFKTHQFQNIRVIYKIYKKKYDTNFGIEPKETLLLL